MKGKTKIIFVGNYKGGVGKTTSVLNFAKILSKQGKKVLVMDLDPQSSLSEILVRNNSIKSTLEDLDDEKTLNYIYDLNIQVIKSYPSIKLQYDKGIIQSYKNQFDFIASSLFYGKNLGLDELAIRMEDNIEYLSILNTFLDSIIEKDYYDFIFIDCPPSNNLITQSAFLLSDYYIIPTILDGISSSGVAHYINTVRTTYNKYCEESILAKHFFGEKPILIGVFCTFIRGQVNYSVATKELKDTLNKNSQEDKEIYFFDEEINNYIDIARSTEVGEESKARNDYNQLTIRVLERIDSIESRK